MIRSYMFIGMHGERFLSQRGSSRFNILLFDALVAAAHAASDSATVFNSLTMHAPQEVCCCQPACWIDRRGNQLFGTN